MGKRAKDNQTVDEMEENMQSKSDWKSGFLSDWLVFSQLYLTVNLGQR